MGDARSKLAPVHCVPSGRCSECWARNPHCASAGRKAWRDSGHSFLLLHAWRAWAVNQSGMATQCWEGKCAASLPQWASASETVTRLLDATCQDDFKK